MAMVRQEKERRDWQAEKKYSRSSLGRRGSEKSPQKGDNRSQPLSYTANHGVRISFRESENERNPEAKGGWDNISW